MFLADHQGPFFKEDGKVVQWSFLTKFASDYTLTWLQWTLSFPYAVLTGVAMCIITMMAEEPCDVEWRASCFGNLQTASKQVISEKSTTIELIV